MKPRNPTSTRVLSRHNGAAMLCPTVGDAGAAMQTFRVRATSARGPWTSFAPLRVPPRRSGWLAALLILLHVARCEVPLDRAARWQTEPHAVRAAAAAPSAAHRRLQGENAFAESPRSPPVAPAPPRLHPAAPVPPLSPLPTRALMVDACETKGAYREQTCRIHHVDTQATIACCFDAGAKRTRNAGSNRARHALLGSPHAAQSRSSLRRRGWRFLPLRVSKRN